VERGNDFAESARGLSNNLPSICWATNWTDGAKAIAGAVMVRILFLDVGQPPTRLQSPHNDIGAKVAKALSEALEVSLFRNKFVGVYGALNRSFVFINQHRVQGHRCCGRARDCYR
jgi:hypothetical protein